MIYKEIIPPPILQPYIHQLLLIKSEGKTAGTTAFKVFADGLPGLIFQQYAGSFCDRDGNPLPQLFVHGLTTRYSEKTATGAFYNLTVRLKPYGLKVLFGVDAHLLTDCYLPLETLVKNSLAEKLSEAITLHDKIAILNAFFIARIGAGQDSEQAKIAQVVKKIHSTNEDLSLSSIPAMLRISERSLERLMKRYVGVSPKLYQRIGRFQNTLTHLYNNPTDRLTRLAYAHAYSDQSHYIREFKQFAGMSPGAFRKRGLSQLRNFPEWR
ncbi:helix-turn-helix domain-containing protein [Taibaiella chishuiensis]